MGACAISGGPFFYNTYSVVKGADHIIPVDVYVAGLSTQARSSAACIDFVAEKNKEWIDQGTDQEINYEPLKK